MVSLCHIDNRTGEGETFRGDRIIVCAGKTELMGMIFKGSWVSKSYRKNAAAGEQESCIRTIDKKLRAIHGNGMLTARWRYDPRPKP